MNFMLQRFSFIKRIVTDFFFPKRISSNNTCKPFKPFSDIPTLKSYPLIGHSYLFFPGGKYTAERLTEAFLDISKNLGTIFKLNLGGSVMVITLDPDHAKILFQNEGKNPERPSFPALLQYRKKVFNSAGVVPGNGQEWYRLRQGVNPLLKYNIIQSYKDEQEKIAKTFVRYIQASRDENLVMCDVYTHLLKYTIEAISIVSPGHRFHCMFNDNNEETDEIIQASIDFMDGLYATLIAPPLWKVGWKTAGYKKLESSHNTIYNILRRYLDKINLQFSENPNLVKNRNPFMHSLLVNENLKMEDKIMVAIEVFLGGLDATATTIALTLHYLSKNKEIQREARERILSSNGENFLKACIKETLRLSPTAGGSGRFLAQDVEMGGYLIPKGVVVLSLHSGMSHNEKYFQNAREYLPQRFMKETRENFHPLASLPFGHGPRMCPGKRLAENEMVILLAEVLKNFVLEPTEDAEVGMVFRMNRIPDRPINIKFSNTNL